MKKYVLFLLIGVSLMLTSGMQAQSLPTEKLEKLDQLLNEARALADSEQYAESNLKCQELIEELQKNDMEELVPTIQNCMARNYMHMGIACMEQRGEDGESYDLLQTAVRISSPDSEMHKMALSWVGNWWSNKAFLLNSKNEQLREAMVMTDSAGYYYSLALKPENMYREKLRRANMHYTLREYDASLAIVLWLIQENGISDVIRGDAYIQAANIYKEKEDYRKAIDYAEEAFKILSSQEGMEQRAARAALCLASIYEWDVPNPNQMAFWNQQYEHFSEASANKTTETDVILDEPIAAVVSYGEDVEAFDQSVKKMKSGDLKGANNSIRILIEKALGQRNYSPNQLADYYSFAAHIGLKLNNYKQAIADAETALDYAHKAGEMSQEDLPFIYNLLSSAYYYAGDKKKSLEASKESVRMAEKYLGATHSQTQSAYDHLAQCQGLCGDMPGMLVSKAKAVNLIRQVVVRNFAVFTQEERNGFWDDQTIASMQQLFNMEHRFGSHQSETTDALYDQQLLTKGLLLTTESALRRAAEQDPELDSQYRELRKLRKQSLDENLQKQEREAAELQADALERSLSGSANELYSYLQFLQVGWKDVQQGLPDDAAAVEFAEYDFSARSKGYGALVLQPGDEHVRFIPLATSAFVLENEEELADSIWQPIIDVLSPKVKKIFFAPSGELYKIPIESHQLADGRLMSKAYRTYRVSSTRMLALRPHQVPSQDAVVYGGLKYKLNEADVSQNQPVKPVAPATPQPRKTFRPKRSRAGREHDEKLEDLPGARKEAIAITDVINARKDPNLKAECMINEKGTEESFKALDRQHRRIIHVATHGYFDAPEAEDGDALSYSGLCFAGAQNYLDGQDVPKSSDDGILTAAEVAEMDLSGLELLSLSACQSGLGVITADGVFGLQRGFKKAGAQALLMSLWKVDDDATEMLMTEFYSQWIGSGKRVSMYDALEAAKEKVRNCEEWEDPSVWSAFILLDGVEF